jgi:isocitrate dehydrogenase kinase/phosphatase
MFPSEHIVIMFQPEHIAEMFQSEHFVDVFRLEHWCALVARSRGGRVISAYAYHLAATSDRFEVDIWPIRPLSWLAYSTC